MGVKVRKKGAKYVLVDYHGPSQIEMHRKPRGG
jgi:hypothetical protein